MELFSLNCPFTAELTYCSVERNDRCSHASGVGEARAYLGGC